MPADDVNVGDIYAQVKVDFGDFDNQIGQLARMFDGLKTAISGIGGVVQQAVADIQGAAAASNTVSEAQTEMAKSVQEASSALSDNLTPGMQAAGQQAVALTTAAASSSQGINKVADVSDETVSAVHKLNQELYSLSEDQLKKVETDAAKAAEELKKIKESGASGGFDDAKFGALASALQGISPELSKVANGFQTFKRAQLETKTATDAFGRSIGKLSQGIAIVNLAMTAWEGGASIGEKIWGSRSNEENRANDQIKRLQDMATDEEQVFKELNEKRNALANKANDTRTDILGLAGFSFGGAELEGELSRYTDEMEKSAQRLEKLKLDDKKKAESIKEQAVLQEFLQNNKAAMQELEIQRKNETISNEDYWNRRIQLLREAANEEIVTRTQMAAGKGEAPEVEAQVFSMKRLAQLAMDIRSIEQQRHEEDLKHLRKAADAEKERKERLDTIRREEESHAERMARYNRDARITTLDKQKRTKEISEEEYATRRGKIEMEPLEQEKINAGEEVKRTKDDLARAKWSHLSTPGGKADQTRVDEAQDKYNAALKRQEMAEAEIANQRLNTEDKIAQAKERQAKNDERVTEMIRKKEIAGMDETKRRDAERKDRLEKDLKTLSDLGASDEQLERFKQLENSINANGGATSMATFSSSDMALRSLSGVSAEGVTLRKIADSSERTAQNTDKLTTKEPAEPGLGATGGP